MKIKQCNIVCFLGFLLFFDVFFVCFKLQLIIVSSLLWITSRQKQIFMIIMLLFSGLTL